MHSFSYIDGNNDLIDARDRGLMYGDGLFETMVARRGQIRWLTHHLERLELGCRRLALPAPSRHEVMRELRDRVPATGRVVVKLVLTRGIGRRGYAPPPEPMPVVIVYVGEPDPDVGETLTETAAETLDLRLSENEKLAGIKHLCRIEQVLAQLELGARRADEGVLLSRSGRVVGCTSANLFVVAGDRILTPDIRTAGVSGVMRRVVLEHCRQLDIPTAEVDIDAAELAGANELFLTNAVVGIRSIGSLDGRRIPSSAMAERLNHTIYGRSHE